MKFDYSTFMAQVDNSQGANVEISPSTLALSNCLNASISSYDFTDSGAPLTSEQADEIDQIIALMFDEMNAETKIIQTLWGYAAPTIDGTGAPTGNVGTRFLSAVNGQILGVKMFTTGGAASDYRGRIYSQSGGSVLADAVATEVEDDWVRATFSTPLNIIAGTNYVAAFFLNGVGAPYRVNFFTSPLVVGDLTAIQDNTGGLRNGLYNTGGSISFPNLNVSATSFFVDVEFVADA